MMIGAGVVLVYTLFGGMWSVALTDFIQMIVMVVGLSLIAMSRRRPGRRRRQGDRAGRSPTASLSCSPRRHRTQRRVLGDGWCVLRDRVRLDPAAGRVPARDVRQEREDGRARHGDRRRRLLLFAFVPMFIVATPCWSRTRRLRELFNATTRATSSACCRPRAGQDAAVDADPVLRRAAVGDQSTASARCWRRPRPSSRTSCGRSRRP